MTTNKGKNPDAPTVDPEVHGIRVNKYIAGLGVSSRREADRMVQEGKVLINGV
ncbi:MAG: pseudouridine synthase, partial [Clostridiaceae bacterium]|nr:pseudouridine synthase [Clostridiaceae bacterium]